MRKNILNSSIQTANCYHDIALNNKKSADILLKMVCTMKQHICIFNQWKNL